MTANAATPILGLNFTLNQFYTGTLWSSGGFLLFRDQLAGEIMVPL